MNESHKQEFYKQLKAIATIASVDMTKEIYTLYWNVLRELTIEQFRHGILQTAKKTTKYYKELPAPGLILACALEQDINTSMINDWQAFRSYVENGARYETSKINRIIHKALGGQQTLGATSPDNFEKWVKKEYEKLYQEYAISGIPKELEQQALPESEEYKALKAGIVKGCF